MRKFLLLTLAAVMTAGVGVPAEATTKYTAHIQLYPFPGVEYPGIDVWVFRRDAANTPIGLRYIKVCLQRQSGSSWVTRSCKKTDRDGVVNWLLYEGYTYRIHVPATAYHHPNYSPPFVARF